MTEHEGNVIKRVVSIGSFVVVIIVSETRTGSSLTLVPDGVLRGVDLRPRLLLDPGQSCGSGPLGSFAGSMSNVLRSRAALHLIGFAAAVL